jgi:hypothetical protein
MATYVGDSSNHIYTSIPMSKSSSSSSSTSNPTVLISPTETSAIEGLEDINVELSPTETSPIEGLGNINPQPFVGIVNMRKAIKAQSQKLQKGDSEQQHLIFTRVRASDLPKIEAARDSMRKHIRLTHYTDTELLIVKIPTAEHESAHGGLAKRVVIALNRMGTPGLAEDEFHFIGATTFYTPNSSKEADSAYRPRSFRPNKNDWPTIVFESGVSETLRHLRSVARWWLTKSGGAVKIVIIISVNRIQSTLPIEKWELSPMTGRRLSTRAFPNAHNIPRPLIPTKIQEITIVSNTVTGAPLVLEFDKIFLRPAVLPETDITFTAQQLSTWASGIW